LESDNESDTSQTLAAREKRGKMSTAPDDLSARISGLGEQIKAAKQAKKPKEEWDPILQEMLRVKATYRQVTGNDYSLPPDTTKNKQTTAPPAVDHVESGGGDDMNKEKRAAKAAREAEKVMARVPIANAA
jgi:seryl-tRNA synthetase